MQLNISLCFKFLVCLLPFIYMNRTYVYVLQGPYKNIPLLSTIIEEANIEGLKCVFRLRPPKSKRDYFIQAPDEESEQRWMQAICFAKVSANSTDHSQTCSLQ